MESIATWLDRDVKVGYAKFAAAFDAVGIEDTSDLTDMNAKLMEELEQELVARDAKSMHIVKIKKALEAIVELAEPIVAPASATRATTAPALGVLVRVRGFHFV